MGQIKQDVQALHLRLFPTEVGALKPFLFNFDINYARRFDTQNAQFSAYILSPDQLMRDGFAFKDELLLIISGYKKLQPRTIQAVETVMRTNPFKGRVDPITYFIVSSDEDIDSWISNYMMSHPQSRTPISLSSDTLSANKNDRWFIRNQLATRLYGRDLFDYQLPLDEDLFFFGRGRIVEEFLDALRKGQNKGLFGLRKTGKTSVLFKIRRACDELNIAKAVYLDCKRPEIRNLHWKELFQYIGDEVSKKLNKKYVSVKDSVKNFTKLISTVSGDTKVVIIFDEIEYISHFAHLDPHWGEEFVPFWQTMWSIQSEIRSVSFIIAGVNPYVCEIDLIDRTQNPMFGIVRPAYLTGLDSSEIQQMIRAIGGRMGLGFEDLAIENLEKRYGGHPLLTRMACSYTNQSVNQESIPRPTPITIRRLVSEQRDREDEIFFYCRHIISELADFYKDEFDMLEMLASGNIIDFNDLALEPGYIRHLKAYGIISVSDAGKPVFRIPVLQRYIAAQRARREGDKSIIFVIDKEKRADWLSRRKRTILHDLKLLLRTIHSKNKWQPYANTFFPEADLLHGACLADSWQSFNSFITDLNKCLVETIDLVNPKGGFYGKLKTEYEHLFESLVRIRLLRNNADHLRLHSQVEDGLKNLLSVDLMGRSITQVDEPWFVLQQITIDELFASIQYELNKLN